MDLETKNDKLFMLKISGIDLAFDAGTLRAVLGFETVGIFEGAQLSNDTITQDFSFHALIGDCVNLEINANKPFTFQDDTYLYDFITTSDPIPQTDGWAKVTCDYISKELL